MTAPARFKQCDLERVFRAAKRAEVRARVTIRPTGEIEAQMLTEGEADEPIWPEMSAKLREIAGADPKLLPLVNQIDRLHKLAVEKGMPVITRGQFERALEEA